MNAVTSKLLKENGPNINSNDFINQTRSIEDIKSKQEDKQQANLSN